MPKRIHLYLDLIESNDREWWPDESKLTITGRRTKEYNGAQPTEVVLHVGFNEIPYLVKALMRPYFKSLKAMKSMKTEITEYLDTER
jgi:hypothetical protein